MELCNWRTYHIYKIFQRVVVGCILLAELVFLFHITSTRNKDGFQGNTTTPQAIHQEQLLAVWTVSERGKGLQILHPQDETPDLSTTAPERPSNTERASPKTVTIPGPNTWLELIRKVTEKRFGRPRPPGSLVFNASSATEITAEKTSIDKLKKILLWNDFYEDKDYKFGVGQEPFLAAGCPINTCYTTVDRGRFMPDQLDAVVWHHRSFDKTFPAIRHPGTRFVYFMVESPWYKFLNINSLAGVFNYTMTYKTDSDVYQPYGIFIKRASPRSDLKDKNFAEGKSKMAVWFASHCGTASKRERLILTLGELIQIDIYGGCGNVGACPLNGSQHNTDACYKRVSEHYKFYLSFENSLCVDYVTEKFFGPARYDIIPVVYGLASYEALAPPHSYINVLDFKSVRHLANYLNFLDKNDTAYNEYFRWKVDYEALMQYKSSTPPSYNQLSWCQLCHKLHTDHSPQVHQDLNQWRSNDSCIKASSKLIQNFIRGKTLSF